MASPFNPFLTKRERMLRGLRAYLHRERTPRFIVFILLLLTFGAGFLTSKALLKIGVVEMVLRYPASVIAAWLVFMLLVRLWAEFERRKFKSPDDIAALANADGPEEDHAPWENSGEATLRILDGADAVDDLPSGLVLILIMILLFLVFGILGSMFVLVWSAPALLAEVFLDAVVVAVLARQIKQNGYFSWAESVLRRTWKCAFGMAIALGIAGAWIQEVKPHVVTIGDLWRRPPAEISEPLELPTAPSQTPREPDSPPR